MFCLYLILNLLVSTLGTDQQVKDYPEGGEEYTYSDSDGSDIENKGGGRLVGARAAKQNEAPFLISMNKYYEYNPEISDCTGSLITPTYVITAAHCTEYIPRPNRNRDNRECVKKTKAGQNYIASSKSGLSFTVQCRWIMTIEKGYGKVRNFEIKIISPKTKVWIGVKDIKSPGPKAEKADVLRAIRHAHSYKGGANYGSYGGYDISLLEIERPFKGHPKACLPSPNFKEGEGLLAGYGQYHRKDFGTKEDVCQTNSYGQMKYHYCVTDCNAKTPAPQSRICKDFFSRQNTPNDVPEDKEEIMVMVKGKPNFCFRNYNKEKKKYGWCTTKENHYNPINSDLDERGWGFCSKDCHLDKQESDAGVLRIVDKAQTLPDELCERFLSISLHNNEVKHRPRIICVGKMKHWSIDVWEKVGAKFMKIPEPRAGKIVNNNHYGEYLGFGGFVASAGTCKGDSGGPMYQKEVDIATGKDKYILTGAVSGGRGKLGACGGINNPVHYARVKKFTSWILQLIGKEESKNLCWDNEFEKKKKKYV